EPPLADAVHREGGRVMVDADTHPSAIRGKIVDAIGHRAAEFLDQEIMDPDLFRMAVGAILAAIVAELSDQFLFLGVDRDDRFLFGHRSGALRVDMGDLCIPVVVGFALLGFAIALDSIALRVSPLRYKGPFYPLAFP